MARSTTQSIKTGNVVGKYYRHKGLKGIIKERDSCVYEGFCSYTTLKTARRRCGCVGDIKVILIKPTKHLPVFHEVWLCGIKKRIYPTGDFRE